MKKGGGDGFKNRAIDLTERTVGGLWLGSKRTSSRPRRLRTKSNVGEKLELNLICLENSKK